MIFWNQALHFVLKESRINMGTPQQHDDFATAHHIVFELQTLHYLMSRGAPQETAEYAIKTAKGKGETDPEGSDPTYIIIKWCAMPNAQSSHAAMMYICLLWIHDYLCDKERLRGFATLQG